MTNLDPLHEAEVLIQFGRLKQAIALLESAVAATPARAELARRLEELRARASQRQPAASVHIAIGWTAYVGSLLAVFSPFIILAGHIPDVQQAPSNAAVAMLGVAGLACIGITTYLSVELFYRVWFAYLNVLPAQARMRAEAGLKCSMTPSIFGKRYETLRARLLRAVD